MKWTRSLPPESGVEVIELEGDGEEVEAEEEEENKAAAKRRKRAAQKREWQARQPVQRCGVDGCEFQTKDKSNLKEHQARVHGIGDVDAEELRRKDRERKARLPVQHAYMVDAEAGTKQHALKKEIALH